MTPPTDHTHDAAAGHRGKVRRITWLGLFVNAGLAAIKFVFGFLGNSYAVVADAVHSVSDMATDVAVLLGVRFWSVPADADHPYGHRRIETAITVFIGLALMGVAAGIAYHALSGAGHAHPAPGGIAIIGVLASVVIKELLYRWTLAVGRDARSSAVLANAWHHRSDAISSIPALVAVGVASLYPAFAVVDRIGAAVVAALIFKVAWSIVSPAMAELTDRGADVSEVATLAAVATGVPGVRSIHGMRTRKVGGLLQIDLHIQVDGDLPVRAGHEIAVRVRDALLAEGPNVVDALIHIEPAEL